MTTAADLLDRYPYKPGTRPSDYPHGSAERLCGIEDPEQREMLARIYANSEARWAKEETARRARELRERHQRMQAQSMEHLDPHWNDR